MLWIQRTAAERINRIPVQHIGQVLVIPYFNLLNLVGCTETVEEMEERHAALNGSKVRHSAQVHSLLRAVGAEHRIASLTACIHVGMIAEDAQRMCRQRTCGTMNDTRKEFTRHLIHVRDHQEQALGSGVCGGQCASCKGAMHCAGCARLGLHLGNLYFSSEKILSVCSSILVRLIRHRGRRGDRIDRSNIRKRIRYMRGGGVAVHSFSLSCHYDIFLLLRILIFLPVQYTHTVPI